MLYFLTITNQKLMDVEDKAVEFMVLLEEQILRIRPAEL